MDCKKDNVQPDTDCGHCGPSREWEQPKGHDDIVQARSVSVQRVFMAKNAEHRGRMTDGKQTSLHES